MRLTGLQEECLVKTHNNGGQLTFHAMRYWSAPGIKFKPYVTMGRAGTSSTDKPVWFYGNGTIRALLNKGLFQVKQPAALPGNKTPYHVELTDKGKQLALKLAEKPA